MFETLYFGQLRGMIWSSEALSAKFFVLFLPHFLFIAFGVLRKFFLCHTLCYAVLVTHKAATRAGKQGKECISYVCILSLAPRWLLEEITAQTMPGAALASAFLPVRQKTGVFPPSEDLYP